MERSDYYTKKNPTTEVYRYTDVDSATGCGLVYSFTASSCCHKALLEDDGSCSAFFLQQPGKKAQDLGATDKGEDWQTSFYRFGLTQSEDFFVNEDLSINAWYQFIGVGVDQWLTVNIDYTNIVVGQNTDETFAVPANCTKTCVGEELEFSRYHAVKAAARQAQKVEAFLN